MTLMTEATNLLGLVAGTLTTVAFVPQVVRTWRTRSTKDISLAMFLLFSVGIGCWLVYGVSISSWPIILANAVTLILSLVILYLKIRHE